LVATTTTNTNAATVLFLMDKPIHFCLLLEPQTLLPPHSYFLFLGKYTDFILLGRGGGGQKCQDPTPQPPPPPRGVLPPPPQKKEKNKKRKRKTVFFFFPFFPFFFLIIAKTKTKTKQYKALSKIRPGMRTSPDSKKTLMPETRSEMRALSYSKRAVVAKG
jgi:hypothetical protein